MVTKNVKGRIIPCSTAGALTEKGLLDVFIPQTTISRKWKIRRPILTSERVLHVWADTAKYTTWTNALTLDHHFICFAAVKLKR